MVVSEDGDNSDNGGAEDDEDGAEQVKQKKRVRTHEGDPLAFSKIPKLTRAYNDPTYYRKMIHKPFLGIFHYFFFNK